MEIGDTCEKHGLRIGVDAYVGSGSHDDPHEIGVTEMRVVDWAELRSWLMEEHPSANTPNYYAAFLAGMVDPYSYCAAHGITNPAIVHAIKYLTRAGKKCGETVLRDYEKAAQAIARAIEMVKEGLCS